MRITSGSFYENFSNRQQIGLADLNKVNNQIATGTTIREGYEDPIILANALKLDHTEAAIFQAKKLAEQARNFSDHADGVLGSFTDNLMRFKVKMVGASNGNHSITSLNAIGQELDVIVNHLKELAKSSINGHYIFSGSDVLTPPIDDNFKYQGNNDKLKVLIGNNVSVSYNVPGKDIFLGSDSDYRKKIISNIPHYNKVLQNPYLLSKPNKDNISKDVYITKDNTIREMVGDNDNDKDNNKKTIFYLRGINTNGDRIKEKLSLDSNDTVSTLTKKIEAIYEGYVDVHINRFGQFELEDKTLGNSNIDFHIFSANDYSDDVINKADANSVEDLLSNKDVYITEYVKSFFNPVKSREDVISQINLPALNEISLKASFLKTDGSKMNLKDKIYEVISSEINIINIDAKDVEGNDQKLSLTVDKDTTIRNLLDKIEEALSSKDKKVIVQFDNEKLIIVDYDKTKNDRTLLELKLSTPGNKSFSSPEAMNLDKIYFNKNNNTLSSNVSQLTKKGFYATRDTLLSDLSSSILRDKTLSIELHDIDGIQRHIEINLLNGGLTFVVDGGETYNIINSNDKFLVGEKSTLSKINVTDSYELRGLHIGDKLSINGEIREIKEIDEKYRHIELDKPLTKLIKSGDIISYDTPSFKRTSPSNFTYGQLMDIMAMGLTNTYPEHNSNTEDYEDAILSTKRRIEVELDHKGRFVIKDLEESLSKIDLAIYDKDSNNFSKNNDSPVVTFNANNAILIDESNIDFFAMLRSAVENIKDGKIISNGNEQKNARKMGILYSIEGVDHLLDHMSKQRSYAGANSLTLNSVIDKAEVELINTKRLKSEIIDTDLPNAILELKQRELNYQALLSTANRIEQLSLVKYL